MNNVFVTGANGFIGSALVNKMISNGISVVAVDISFEHSHLIESDLLTKVTLDLNSDVIFDEHIPMYGYDAFYHLAWTGVNGPNKANPIVQLENAKLTVKCAEFAKKTGCKKFLCAGTIAERAVESLPDLKNVNGGMMYGIAKDCTHKILETYCKNIGLNFVWMQFSNIYGPLNKTGNLISYTIGELIANKEASFGPAVQPYDFIYVDDLIEAVYKVGICENKHDFYYIGSGKPRLLKDYLFEIGELCNKKELIKIGIRKDDGIKYDYSMFDNTALCDDIGDYISTDFTAGILKTLESYE